jgi:sugar (pentulose or hexulose) kinase
MRLETVRRRRRKYNGAMNYVTIEGTIGVGAGGVICLPYLMGERTTHMDPDAAALFCGLRLHHSPAHHIRAVIEGVAFALRDSREVLCEMGIQPRNLGRWAGEPG